MIIYFTTNSKIWLLAYPFLIVGPPAGGAAEIFNPNSILKNKMIIYFTTNSKIWLLSMLIPF